MTLVVAMTQPDSIWLMVDRRLTAGSRVVSDEATKLTLYETGNDAAILGYAGLGLTKTGMEPSQWMSNVLRGHNRSIPDALSLLAAVMRRELPPHLRGFAVGNRAHSVLVPSLIGGKPQLWSIDVALPVGKADPLFRHTEYVVSFGPTRPPRLAFAGSGARQIGPITRRFERAILRAEKRYDGTITTAYRVADELAQLNYAIHLREPTVGPNCIVAWRNSRTGRHRGGGGHVVYEGLQRLTRAPAIPSIGLGMDMKAFAEAMMPILMENSRPFFEGGEPKELDKETLDAALASLPSQPDERLR